MKVLLTDDSMTIRIIIRDLLKELGYSDITECRNGEEALQVLQKEHFDLILLDIHMPKMDGLTVLENVRSEPCMGNESIPVVFITSDTDYRQIERAKSLNAFGYIKKPFRKEGLERAIKAAENAERKRVATEGVYTPAAAPVDEAQPVAAEASAPSAETTTAGSNSKKTSSFSWMRSILGK